MNCSLPGSSVCGDSPVKNTAVGCHALLQGNLPNPGIKPRSSTLQADSLPCTPPVPFLGGVEIRVFISCLFSEDWLHYLQLLKIRYTVWYDFPSGTFVFRGGIVTCLCVISSIQLLSHVQLFVTPWTAACQASLSITNSQSSLKLMSIELVMPSNHLILRHPLFLPPSVFPSIQVFSNESVLHIRWPKYWSFSFNISPSNEYSGLIFLRMDWLNLLAVQGTRIFSNTVQNHRFFAAQLSL